MVNASQVRRPVKLESWDGSYKRDCKWLNCQDNLFAKSTGRPALHWEVGSPPWHWHWHRHPVTQPCTTWAPLFPSKPAFKYPSWPWADRSFPLHCSSSNIFDYKAYPQEVTQYQSWTALLHTWCLIYEQSPVIGSYSFYLYLVIVITFTAVTEGGVMPDQYVVLIDWSSYNLSFCFQLQVCLSKHPAAIPDDLSSDDLRLDLQCHGFIMDI